MIWPRKIQPRTRFVMLFQGRTGSSFLMSCLDSHPAVVAEGERFVGKSATQQRRWLHRLYGRRRDPAVLACGFKTKLKDVWDLDAFAGLLREFEVRVLTMYRRNKVKLAVSVINSHRLHQSTGHWNRQRGMAALPPFELQASDLRAQLERGRQRDEQLAAFTASLGLSQKTLYYEDLLADPQVVLRETLAFLDVDVLRLDSPFVKTTDDDLQAALLNYDALRAEFAGGEHEAMF